MPRALLLALCPLSLLALTARPALAQDKDREPGWYDQAELSYVQTGGNAEASTLGMKNTLERVWGSSIFSFKASALRAESTTFTRFATGSPEAFVVVEDKDSALTAENYSVRLRYDRQLSERRFWFTGASWERNEFAGFEDRTIVTGGVGNIWWQNDRGHFRTDYGVTWSEQTDVVPNPGADDSTLGVQLSSDYQHAFGTNAAYSNELVLNGSVDQTDDFRADWTHAVQVSLTQRLALKVSLQLLYDHQPALTAVPLLDGDGGPTGTTVLVELDDLDTQFTAALVVSF